MNAITWAPLMREVLGIISMRWLFKCTFYAYVQLVTLTGTVGLIYHLGALSKDYGPLISHTGPTRPRTFQRWASAYCQKTEKNKTKRDDKMNGRSTERLQLYYWAIFSFGKQEQSVYWLLNQEAMPGGKGGFNAS